MFCLDWIGRVQTLTWLAEKVGANRLPSKAGITVVGVVGLAAMGWGIWDFFQSRRKRKWAEAHTKTQVVRFKYVPLDRKPPEDPKD